MKRLVMVICVLTIPLLILSEDGANCSSETGTQGTMAPPAHFPSPNDALNFEKDLEMSSSWDSPDVHCVNTDHMLSAFLHGLCGPNDPIFDNVRKKFSIHQCHQGGIKRRHTTSQISIIRENFDSYLEAVRHYIVLFSPAGEKVYERLLHQGSARYRMRAIDPQGEGDSRLILLLRMEGLGHWQLTYEIYRAEQDQLDLLWRWDGGGISDHPPNCYSFSNVDTSQATLDQNGKVIVYRTTGCLSKEPDIEYERVLFKWDSSPDRFIESERVKIPPN